MTISVTNLGINSNGAGATITVASVTVPATATIIVCVNDASNAVVGGSVSDGTNTYTRITGASLNAVQANGFGAVFYSANVVALSGATITYTKAVSGGNCAISACYATGVTASPLDSAVTATATGSSNAPSVTTGTPGQAGDLIVGVVAFSNINAGGINQASGFAIPPNESGLGSGNGAQVAGGNLVDADTSTKTYNPTFVGLSSLWAAIVVGFKGASGAGNAALTTATLVAAFANQYNQWPYEFTGGAQPYAPARLAPSITAVAVNNPPFSGSDNPALMAIEIAAAQPAIWPYEFMGGLQPYMQRQLSPAITGVTINNPPFGIPPDWLVNVVQAWQAPSWPYHFMGNPQPYEGLMLPPSQTAVPVNDPPFVYLERDPITVSLKQFWQPDPWPPRFLGGRQPYDGARLPPSITAVPVNEPPYQHPERWAGMPAIRQPWQPDPWPPTFLGNAQPYGPRTLNPRLTAVQIDNPPFQMLERWAGLSAIKWQWLPPDWPIAFIGGRQPYEPSKLNPFITAVEVDNPPFGIPNLSTLAAVAYQWQPDPWPPVFMGGKQAYEPKKLSPGIPGQSVDPPPFNDGGRTQLEMSIVSYAQPDPWVYAFMGGRQPFEPRKLSPGVPGQSIDNPPFRHPSKLAQTVTEISYWQPEPWPSVFMGGWGPYTPRRLNPSITSVIPPVNQSLRNVIIRCRLITGSTR